jgi:hypothetical protein
VRAEILIKAHDDRVAATLQDYSGANDIARLETNVAPHRQAGDTGNEELIAVHACLIADMGTVADSHAIDAAARVILG